MQEVFITKIEVSEEKKLLVTPVDDNEKSKNLYPYIYRMATGVYWDEEKRSFSSPIPREWSYFQWYENIIDSATSELGIELVLTPETQWVNVPDVKKRRMEEAQGRRGCGLFC